MEGSARQSPGGNLEHIQPGQSVTFVVYIWCLHEDVHLSSVFTSAHARMRLSVCVCVCESL